MVDPTPGFLWIANPVDYSIRKVDAHSGEVVATRGWDADHQPPYSVHREGEFLWVVTPNWVHRFRLQGEVIPLMDNLGIAWRQGQTNSELGFQVNPRIPSWGATDPDRGGTWGAHSNGRIPLSELCSIGGGHMLRCDAATAWDAMSTAYGGIPITDSYRSYEAQVDVKRRKPHLAATPGKSNHGWGIAVDVNLGGGGFSSALYQWLWANAGAYGWFHPGWAQQGGSKPEAWHWEYSG